MNAYLKIAYLHCDIFTYHRPGLAFASPSTTSSPHLDQLHLVDFPITELISDLIPLHRISFQVILVHLILTKTHST